MSIVMFYHLSRSSPETTMTGLLSRALAQGWRVMLRGTDLADLQRLDGVLWQEPEEGFLPHGVAGGIHDADQPILLGTGEIANAADALMLVQGADSNIEEVAALKRVWVLFDGGDTETLASARKLWTRLTGAGIAAQYWTEESGRWELKIERVAQRV